MHLVLTLTAILIFCLSSTVLMADEKVDCLEGNDHDLRIEACSAVLNRNPNDAIAYYARGVAYELKGDFERAISDYTTAIELNPYHASAYDGRGRAYASKGDYTRAVADVTKAGELIAASTQGPIAAGVALSKNAERAADELKTITPTSASAAIKEDELLKGAPAQNKRDLTKTHAHRSAQRVSKPMKPEARKAAAAAEKKPAQPKQGTWPAWVPQGISEN